MNLDETKDIIIKWMLSCDTAEQIILLTEVIDRFIVDRFNRVADPIELELAVDEIKEAMDTQKLIIVNENKSS